MENHHPIQFGKSTISIRAIFSSYVKLPESKFLAGGLEHFFDFPYLGDNHQLTFIFFRGLETTTQIYIAN